MSRGRMARVIDSPVLLACFLLLGAALVTASYRTATASLPPPIAGFDWAQRPDTLLLSVPPNDCGCGLSLSQWISAASARGLHVLIAASASDDNLRDLKKAGFPARRVSILTDVDAGTMRRLSPRDQTTATLVRHGRVVSKLESGMPPPSFFQ